MFGCVIPRASRGDGKRENASYRMFFPKVAFSMKRLTTEWIATADEDYLVVVELGCSPKLTCCNLICCHCFEAILWTQALEL